MPEFSFSRKFSIGLALWLAALAFPIPEALALSKSASKASQGKAEKYFKLGERHRYRLGFLGLPNLFHDYKKAARYYKKAAELGHLKAHHTLGYLYHHGRGVPKSQAKSLQHYEAAAEGGLRAAQSYLGFIYFEQQPPNYKKAFYWSLKAPDASPLGAARRLGFMYRDGLGTPRDLTEAYIWFAIASMPPLAYQTKGGQMQQRASLSEHVQANAKYRDALAAQLSPEQLKQATAEAERRAQELLETKQFRQKQ